jgi:DNA-binding transcriptional ArsR family regulator
MPSPRPLDLDHIFEALAHKHRREIIYTLSLQPASISQLAEQRGLSLPAIHKHLKLLEQGGLIQRRKFGRVNYLALRRAGLRQLQAWANQFQTHWGSDEQTLENYAAHLTRAASQPAVSKSRRRK